VTDFVVFPVDATPESVNWRFYNCGVNMFQNINNLKEKVAVAALLASASAASFAQETGGTTTDLGVAAIEGLKATGTAYITAAFGVAVLVAGGFWGISMMKKAYSKAG